MGKEDARKQQLGPSYDLVLFDMDGTLLDSGDAHYELFTRFWEKSPYNKEHTKKVRKDAGPTIWDVFSPLGFPEGRIAELYKDLSAFYSGPQATDVIEKLTFVPDAQPLLAALREGGVKAALVTNTHEVLVREILARNEAQKWFDAVSASSAERQDKRGRMRSVMEQFDVAPGRTLYVGDNECDVASARAVGVDCCIAVTPICWTYSIENLMRKMCPDYTVSRLSALRKLVL